MTTFRINLGVAAVAIASPAWLELFTSLSPLLTVVLQVLGIALAALQIVRLARDWNKPQS